MKHFHKQNAEFPLWTTLPLFTFADKSCAVWIVQEEGFWQTDLFHPRANPRAKKFNFWQKMAKREFSFQDSNPRPCHYESAAMPTELTLHLSIPFAEMRLESM